MEEILEFHHVGLLTGQPDIAKERLKILGYTPGKTIYEKEVDVFLSMCVRDDKAPLIELVTPKESNIALSKLLKRKDDYIYHICFSCSQISSGLRSLKGDNQSRIIEVVPPFPAILFNGALVAFYIVPSLGLIELLQRDGQPSHDYE